MRSLFIFVFLLPHFVLAAFSVSGTRFSSGECDNCDIECRCTIRDNGNDTYTLCAGSKHSDIECRDIQFPSGEFVINITGTCSLSGRGGDGGWWDGVTPCSCSGTASHSFPYINYISWSMYPTCSNSGYMCSGINNGFRIVTSCNFFFDENCEESQIATIDSAFYTGTHSNPPRYELFQLPSNCPKTVVPVSSLPNSSSPAIDNNNQLNVAVSLDGEGNFVSEGWSNDYTQAIFVPAEQTQEQLGCASADPDGYFVFCSDVSGSGSPPTHTVCSGLPCPGSGGGGGFPSNRPPDDVTIFTPNPGGGGNGNGGGSSSSGNDFNSNLTKWEDMLKRVIPQSIPNPIPMLTKIYDKLVEFKGFVVELFEPQDDPDVEFDFEPDDMKLDSLDIDIDTNFVLDTIPEIDTKWLDSLANTWDIEKALDSLRKEQDSLVEKEGDAIIDKYKKKLDSLKPDTAKVADKTKEKVLETFKDMADKIKEAVAKGLKPIEKMLPNGDGGCSCLEDSFKGLQFGIKKGSGVNVGAMGNTSLICDNIATVRKIIMVIVAVSSVGMILATLRGR